MIDFQNINILIVEDDISLLEILSDLLALEGAKVFSAFNGKEALDVIKQNSIDFVISDIQMPIMTGVELLENIRNLDPKIPIVLLATGEAQITKDEIMAKGAIGLIYKPFNFDEVKNIIINALC